MKYEVLLWVLHLVWAMDRKSGKLPPALAGLKEWNAKLTLAITGDGRKRTERHRGDSGESVAPKPDLPARP